MHNKVILDQATQCRIIQKIKLTQTLTKLVKATVSKCVNVRKVKHTMGQVSNTMKSCNKLAS